MMPSPDEIADARHELTGTDAAPPASDAALPAPNAAPRAPGAGPPLTRRRRRRRGGDGYGSHSGPAAGAPASAAEGEQPPAQPEDKAQKLEQLRQDAQEDQETTQMLSQIADIKTRRRWASSRTCATEPARGASGQLVHDEPEAGVRAGGNERARARPRRPIARHTPVQLAFHAPRDVGTTVHPSVGVGAIHPEQRPQFRELVARERRRRALEGLQCREVGVVLPEAAPEPGEVELDLVERRLETFDTDLAVELLVEERHQVVRHRGIAGRTVDEGEKPLEAAPVGHCRTAQRAYLVEPGAAHERPCVADDPVAAQDVGALEEVIAERPTQPIEPGQLAQPRDYRVGPAVVAGFVDDRGEHAPVAAGLGADAPALGRRHRAAGRVVVAEQLL